MAIGQDIGARDGDSATEQAQQKVQDAGRQAQQQARRATSQARDRVREQVDQRSTDVGEKISSQASDLRTVAGQLREQGKDMPAQAAERAAQQGERVASYFKESNSDRLLRDAEDFTRRQPWVVVAGGMALGLALSRVVKASSGNRHQRSAQQLPAGPRPSPMAPPAQPSAPIAPAAAADPALDDGRLAGRESQ